MAITEVRLSDGLLVIPEEPRCSALVLAGSSGRVDGDRARLLARQGAAVLALRWFGGPGQSPGICEVPLEEFTASLDRLHALHPLLAVIGLSKGAEAALLLACNDPRIRLVAGLSPTSVVWANVGPGPDGQDRPLRSSFSREGVGLPFMPYDESWVCPPGRVPSWVGLYEQSLTVFADRVAAATIPVEKIAGEVVLTAGGDDMVWPSALFAAQIAARRASAALSTTVLSGPDAGHRLLLPGESPPEEGMAMARGGSEFADRSLGADLWAVLVERLNLQE